MTERLAEIEDRITSYRQLRAVIGAMRGISAARAKEASRRVSGIEVYARTIGEAIGQALALALIPQADRTPAAKSEEGRETVILIAAEHGFAGAFSERVFDALERSGDERRDLFVLGSRGLPAAEERGLEAAWSAPMITQPEQAAALATRLAEAIYPSLAQGRTRRLSTIHATTDGDSGLSVISTQLIPFDFSRFPAPPEAQAPLTYVPAGALLSRLVDEYIFAQISAAIVLSLAAENEARARSMMAAHSSISNSLDGLSGTARRLRQEAITEEIVELVAGRLEA